MNKRYRLSCYLAGPMENVSLQDMSDWRTEVTNKLKHDDLLIYDPVVQEVAKGDMDASNQIEILNKYKETKDWKSFYDSMWRIWFGTINKNTDLVQLLENLRMRKHIDGNTQEIIQYWGDSEAVVRSDFIIVYIPKETRMVGTIFEVMLAFLFRIPIYLILPGYDETEANSSLLFGNMISNNGKINTYDNIDDCIKQIRKDYHLN